MWLGPSYEWLGGARMIVVDWVARADDVSGDADAAVLVIDLGLRRQRHKYLHLTAREYRRL